MTYTPVLCCDFTGWSWSRPKIRLGRASAAKDALVVPAASRFISACRRGDLGMGNFWNMGGVAGMYPQKGIDNFWDCFSYVFPK